MREATLKTFCGSSSTLGPDQAAADLRLLAERQGVRREPEVLVRPHLPGEADAGLDLVHDEEALVLAAMPLQRLQELRAEVVVAALGLDGLDDDGRDVVGVVGEGALRIWSSARSSAAAHVALDLGRDGEAQLGVVDARPGELREEVGLDAGRCW